MEGTAMPPRAVVGFVVVLCCGVVCAGVKKTCLHYALLPGWDAAVESRRDAQDELHSPQRSPGTGMG